MLTNRSILLIILTGVLFPDLLTAQLRMGLLAGPSLTTNTLNHVVTGVIHNDTKDSSLCFCGVKEEKTRASVSYSAGFTIDYTISDEFSISVRTLFATKGWNEKVYYHDFNPGDSAVTFDSYDKYRFWYIELPLYFIFTAPLGKKDLLFHAGFGGYVDFALAGKYEFHVVDKSHATARVPDSILTAEASEDGLANLMDSATLIAISRLQRKYSGYSANSMDIGVTALLGIEMGNGLHVDLTINSGLKNVLTGSFYAYQRTNRFVGMALSIGYYINKK
jgi:hypothetical protein